MVSDAQTHIHRLHVVERVLIALAIVVVLAWAGVAGLQHWSPSATPALLQ